jgi:hypothetical protein
MEINKLEEDVLDRNAKTIELEAEIAKLKETIKNNSHYTKSNEILLEEKESEIEELSTDLEQALNNANKSYNPEAKLKLSVSDLIVVRGIFVANSFLFNSLHNIDQCIEKKKDEVTKQQLTLIKKDLEKEWQRVVDLLKVFAKEFSDSNWNRMIKEVQKITDVSVQTMNSRELGHFTVGKNDELDIEYKIRPLVTKAIETCIHSAGSNQLTAYSKECLIKDVVKICEEK